MDSMGLTPVPGLTPPAAYMPVTSSNNEAKKRVSEQQAKTASNELNEVKSPENQRFSIGYKKLKDTGGKAALFIQRLLFYRNDLNTSNKDIAFRLTLPGAIKSAASLQNKISWEAKGEGTENESIKTVKGKVKLASKALIRKTMIGVASRLLTLAAVPFEMFRQANKIPNRISKALQLAHAQSTHPQARLADKAKIALTTVASIGKTLAAPFIGAAMGLSLSIMGAENMKDRKSLANKVLKPLGNFMPKGLDN